MIDVVFLLLIFFLVTTTFLRPEQQLSSSIKVNEKETAQTKSDLEPAIVDVFRLQQSTWFRIGAVTTNDVEEIRATLMSFENKIDGAFVRVSDDVPFEAAAQIIGACRASGFKSVSYLPLKSE